MDYKLLCRKKEQLKQLYEQLPKEVLQRFDKSFEIEYYLENGFETYLNGEKIPIFADHILIARPGDVRYSRLPFKTAFLKFSADGELAEMLNSSPKYFTAIHKKQILELIHETIHSIIDFVLE